MLFNPLKHKALVPPEAYTIDDNFREWSDGSGKYKQIYRYADIAGAYIETSDGGRFIHDSALSPVRQPIANEEAALEHFRDQTRP